MDGEPVIPFLQNEAAGTDVAREAAGGAFPSGSSVLRFGLHGGGDLSNGKCEVLGLPHRLDEEPVPG
jgi:hypothetical protein